ITGPPPIVASIDISSDYNGSEISCNGASDGQITITASGGTGAFTYSINGGGSYQASNVFSGLPAGSYPVRVKDANNCIVGGTVTITAPPAIVASASNTPILCFGGTSTLTVSASGGTGTLTYQLNPGSITNGTGIYPGLFAGSYTYTVTD